MAHDIHWHPSIDNALDLLDDATISSDPRSQPDHSEMLKPPYSMIDADKQLLLNDAQFCTECAAGYLVPWCFLSVHEGSKGL